MYIMEKIYRKPIRTESEDGRSVILECPVTGLVEIFEYDTVSHDYLISYKASDGRWQRIYRHDDGRAYRYEDSAGNVEVIDYREMQIVRRFTDKYGNVRYEVEDREDY